MIENGPGNQSLLTETLPWVMVWLHPERWRVIVHRSLLLFLISILAGAVIATEAEALVLCAKLKKSTGEIRDGTPIKLRTECRTNEEELPPQALGVPAEVSARVYNSSVISVAPNVDHIVSFDSERWDIGDVHDPGNPSRLTAPVSGRYLVTCHVVWEIDNNGGRAIAIVRNGDTSTRLAWDHSLASVAYTRPGSLSTIVELSAGDYVELLVGHDSGGSLDIRADPERSPECSIAKVG